MDDIDRQYIVAILESLEAALSPDKALIDKGQHQLSALESRPGMYPHRYRTDHWNRRLVFYSNYQQPRRVLVRNGQNTA
jgi:hypothetical protein